MRAALLALLLLAAARPAAAQFDTFVQGTAAPVVVVGGGTSDIDGASAIASSSSPVHYTLTTTSANDIIVVELVTSGSCTGISDVAGLTWVRRDPVASGRCYYSANSAGVLTGDVISVTLSSGTAQGLAYGIKGSVYATPFDTNVALPAIGTTSATYSTTQTADLLMCFYNSSGTSAPSPCPGFTAVATPAVNVAVGCQTVTGAQTSVTATPPNTPTTTIVDAFQ